MSTIEDFMRRCAEAGCVVVPVKAYSRYNAAGNLDESDYIGIRYSVRETDSDAVGPDSWFMVDECGCADFESAEAALAHWESTLGDAYVGAGPEKVS